jgi:hypothetical protein
VTREVAGPVRCPRTFVEVCGGPVGARRLLSTLGLIRQDGRGEPTVLLLGVAHAPLFGIQFRLSFNRQSILKMSAGLDRCALGLGSFGWLEAPVRYPETFYTGIVGQPIHRIVDHPILALVPMQIDQATGRDSVSLFRFASEAVDISV